MNRDPEFIMTRAKIYHMKTAALRSCRDGGTGDILADPAVVKALVLLDAKLEQIWDATCAAARRR